MERSLRVFKGIFVRSGRCRTSVTQIPFSALSTPILNLSQNKVRLWLWEIFGSLFYKLCFLEIIIILFKHVECLRCLLFQMPQIYPHRWQRNISFLFHDFRIFSSLNLLGHYISRYRTITRYHTHWWAQNRFYCFGSRRYFWPFLSTSCLSFCSLRWSTNRATFSLLLYRGSWIFHFGSKSLWTALRIVLAADSRLGKSQVSGWPWLTRSFCFWLVEWRTLLFERCFKKGQICGNLALFLI